MDIDLIPEELDAEKARAALKTSFAQADQLFGFLSAYVSEGVVEKMKDSFYLQIKKDLE